MTNQEIIELATDKGFDAKIEKNGVVVRLFNRKISTMEAAAELDIPRWSIFGHKDGVQIFGSDS